MDNYQPQQLSTYALTLFPYEANIDGQKISVGAPLAALARRHRRAALPVHEPSQ